MIPPIKFPTHPVRSLSVSSSSSPTGTSSLGTPSYSRPLVVHNVAGLTPFVTAWSWQKRLVREKVECERWLKSHATRNDGDGTICYQPQAHEDTAVTVSAGFTDRLLLVEHEPIYTLGRNSTHEHLRFPSDIRVRVIERGELSVADEATATRPDVTARDRAQQESDISYEVIRVERGGEVTYHGPGQLVMYPLLALNPTPVLADSDSTTATNIHRPYRADLHWFLRSLESVVIRLLSLYGITGERLAGASGVWVNTSDESSSRCMQKVAAIGLSCSSWVSMHGCAINIDADLAPYEWIVPCGLDDATKYGGVTGVRQILEAAQARRERERQRGGQQQSTPPPPPVSIDLSTVRRQLVRCFEEEFGITADLTSAPPTWKEDGSRSDERETTSTARANLQQTAATNVHVYAPQSLS